MKTGTKESSGRYATATIVELARASTGAGDDSGLKADASGLFRGWLPPLLTRYSWTRLGAGFRPLEPPPFNLLAGFDWVHRLHVSRRLERN